MTHVTPMDEFMHRLGELDTGRRGCIAIPRFVREMGGDAMVLRTAAKALGYKVEPHGKYGYCVFPA